MKEKEQPITGYFLGLTAIDFQYLVDPFPKENSKNKALDFDIALGGPAINAAAAFSHLGGKVKTFSVVGDHVMRPFLVEEFEKYALNLHDLSPNHPHYPTLASVWTSQKNGDRTIVTNKRISPKLDFAILTNQFTLKPDIILVDGFYMEAAIRLAKWGQENGIPVVMDGGSWKEQTDELLKYIDIAICSADFHLPDSNIPFYDYFQQKGTKKVAITRGGKPIDYFEDGEIGRIEVPKIKAIDTLGAGDIFHGAFCYYFGMGNGFRESLRLASLIAGESCKYFGAKGWMGEIND